MIKDSTDQEIITLALLIGSILSFLGCLFIIFCYYLLRLKIFAFKLVLYIAISDLIHAICLCLPLSDPWCHMQAFLLEYSSLSSILWSTITAYSIHDSVINLNPNVQAKEKLFLFIGFFIPLVIACLPEISQAYGYAQGWCWIVDKEYDFLYRILCFYLILVIIFVYNCVVYWRVWRKVYKEILSTLKDEEINKINRDIVARLKMYPVVMVLSYAGLASKRFVEMVWPEHEIFWLIFVAGALMSLIGFLDALVYGFSREVRERIKWVCRGRNLDEFDTGLISSIN